MANYAVDESFLERRRGEIDKGEPAEFNILDKGNMSWRKVMARVSYNPIPEGEEAEVFMTKGDIQRYRGLHIKIIEDLSDEDMIPSE